MGATVTPDSNGTAPRLQSISSYATKDDVVEGSKAVHDHLRKQLDEQVKQLEVELGVRFGKILDSRDKSVLTEAVKGFQIEFVKQLEVRDKSLTAEFDRRVKALHEEFDRRTAEIDRQYGEKMIFVQKAYEAGLEQVKSILRMMPTPQITLNVPEQPTPVVNVTVPEQKSIITVDVPKQPTPVVNVTVPEQGIPVVNVTVPEQKPPEVRVEIPPPRLVKKTFEYDPHGRPVSITEQEQ